MKSTSPDSGILARSLAGDPDAWSALVREHSPLVFRTALRVGLGREDAEDVTQSTWMVLLERGHAIRNPEALPAWLVTTTRRLALQARGRGRARPTEELPPHVPALTPSIEQILEQEQEIAKVRRALHSLPLRCRTLLGALFRDEKPNYEDVSSRLGIPHGSIGPTRARCLAHLSRLLEQDRNE